ncbi:MAG: thioredoxin [Spirochaetaceae bacterium]|nr:thioredoxin [Spirochaetaceae bacterium]
MASQVTITNDNFEAEVEKSEVPVLVDFWAEWCMPCKMVAPVVEEIAQAYDGKLKVGRIDVDAEGDLAARFNVMSIPTLIVFNGGEVVGQRVGAVPRPAIETLFKELV